MLKLIPTKDLDQTTTLSHQNCSLAPSSVRFGSNFHPIGIFYTFSHPMELQKLGTKQFWDKNLRSWGEIFQKSNNFHPQTQIFTPITQRRLRKRVKNTFRVKNSKNNFASTL